MPVLHLSNPCADCKIVEASIDSRKRCICCECFINYIGSKPVKRIQSYHLQDHAPEQTGRILLPLSGGISSAVLLQILDRYLQRQLIKRGHSPCELLLLMVETPFLKTDRDLLKCFDALKNRFSNHSFTLLSLSTVFDLDVSIAKDLAIFGTVNQGNAQASLEDLMASARSASVRADLLDILLVRLIVAFAKANECHAVLWGHSNTRLAAKSLAAVAEGRGGSLPFLISDGLSPWGVPFYYPLRDLFKPELINYARALPEGFSELIIHDTSISRQPTSVRHTTISDLLSNYINTQGEKYPSVMANVVRTVDKLREPKFSSETPKCSVCVMPRLVHDGGQNQADLGDQLPRPPFCFACNRSLVEMTSRYKP